jgi:hypothetical protein
MASWSGWSEATTSSVGPGDLSSPPTPSPPVAVSTLPQKYAAYLQAIKTTGRPPAGTPLAPGYFTTALIATNYYPPAKQRADGLTDNTVYYTQATDPVWQFAGSQGTTAVCGTVRFRDTLKATTIPLTQSPAEHPYGSLATGTYTSVTITGLHLACFQVYPDPSQPVAVIGSWGDVVSATGSPIHAQIKPV